MIDQHTGKLYRHLYAIHEHSDPSGCCYNQLCINYTINSIHAISYFSRKYHAGAPEARAKCPTEQSA
jgi:hypothetical protein